MSNTERWINRNLFNNGVVIPYVVFFILAHVIMFSTVFPSEVEATSDDIRLERIIERQARALEKIAKNTERCGCP